NDAVLMLIYPISIPANVVILGQAFNDYPVPPTAVRGSFFVGAYLSDAESGFDPAIGVDTSHPQTNQSWIIENDRGPRLLDLEAPAATSTLLTPLNTYVNGNHMIRARYTVIPGCLQAPSGLVSWWRAEGNAKDAVSSNQGTLLGNTIYSPGKAGNGFLLDGNGDGVNV